DRMNNVREMLMTACQHTAGIICQARAVSAPPQHVLSFCSGHNLMNVARIKSRKHSFEIYGIALPEG
ncbi:hypothetical protein J6590_023917, partial [Homalodisca vitripennis]